MIHTKNKQPFELCFGALYQTVSVLLLTHVCGGQSQRTGPPQPIVAMVGDDVILPCQLEHAADAVSMTVEWSRADLNPRFVHLRREGVDLLIDQNPSYIGRTSLSTDKLRRGDLSLKLSRVKLTDEGTYRCFSPTQQRQMEVQLAVGFVSWPAVIISKVSSGLILECRSGDWYPEPEVSWLDGEGHVLSAGPPETVRGPDGLYTVSSRVTVEKRHGNRFTCRVQQKTTNQTRETQIHVPDDFCVSGSPSVPIGAGLTVSVCCVCAAAAVWLWKRKHNKTQNRRHSGDKTSSEDRETSNNLDLQPLNDVEDDGQKHNTKREKTKCSNRTVEPDEESQKKEAECKDVLNVLNSCKEQLKLLSSMIERHIRKHKVNMDNTWFMSKKEKYEGEVKELRRQKENNEELQEEIKRLIERQEEKINQKDWRH